MTLQDSVWSIHSVGPSICSAYTWTMYSASMRLDAMELFLTLIHTSGAKEHVSTYQGCQESGEASGKVHTGYIGPFKKLLIPNG